jgi:rod shape-determining protein MreC
VPRQRSVSAVLGSSVARPRPQPFPSRTRSALRRRAVVGGLVVLSLILITISFREPTSGPLHGIESAGVTVLRPFEVAAERVARPFRDVYGYFRGLVHAKNENKKLREQINRLRQVALQGETARQENEQLRAELDYVDGPRYPNDYHAVNTRIISWASEFDQQVLIAAGADRGIREDSPVVTRAGLVGRVTDLNGDAAQVTLIVDESSAVPALDLQHPGAVGLVRPGQGEDTLILDRVTKDRNVEEGDIILTAGTRSSRYPSLFPRGIGIGVVTHVGQSDISPYKQIQIDPFVDFSSLDAVTALITRKRMPKAP